jgi:signal transduction histidine kinase
MANHATPAKSGINAVAERAEDRARLLVLDDEPGVCATLAAVLRHQGYDVRTATTLAAAVGLLGEAAFDLILIDLRLEGAEGHDVLTELRAIAAGATFVVLTSYATLELALQALQSGAYAYVVKPTDVEELRLVVARGLERRRLERELVLREERLQSVEAEVHQFHTGLRSRIDEATLALQGRIEALNEENVALRHAQEQHERFVAMVAHELRGPLGVMMGYAQLATKPTVTPEQVKRFTAAILEHCMRLNRLVEDLQTATRLTTGRFDLRREPTDLATAVEAAVEQFRVTVADRHFSFVGEPNLGSVEMDRDRVLQAVRNLLDNAVKYSTDGGAIEVRVWSDERTVSISVSDEGAGIPESELPNITRAFVRGSASGEVPGSGLGLYITRGIVEAHGGTLRVRNAAGPERAGGAIFTITLPRTAAGLDAAEG